MRKANPLAVEQILKKLDDFREQGVGEGHPDFRAYFERLYEFELLPEDAAPLAPGKRLNLSGRYPMETIADLHGTLVTDGDGHVVSRDLFFAADIGTPPRVPRRLRKAAKRWHKRTSGMFTSPWKDVYFMTAGLLSQDLQRQYQIPDWFTKNARNQTFAVQYFMIPNLETIWSLRSWGRDRLSTQMAGMFFLFEGADDALRIPTDAHGWPVGRQYASLGTLLFAEGLYEGLKDPTQPPHKNTIREAVHRGLAKSMALRDAMLYQDALGLTIRDMPQFLRRRYELAMQAVTVGLRDHAYGQKPSREE